MFKQFKPFNRYAPFNSSSRSRLIFARCSRRAIGMKAAAANPSNFKTYFLCKRAAGLADIADEDFLRLRHFKLTKLFVARWNSDVP